MAKGGGKRKSVGKVGKGRAGAVGVVSAGGGANGRVAWLTIEGATHHNLKAIDAHFPLGRFTCVTGVSGSGKSSLVNDILYAVLARELNRATTVEAGGHAGVKGLEHLDKVIAIDQSPIGRTPRSNPATYIKLFDEIRTLFAKLPDAKLRGYKPGRFSFNVAGRRGGGRCEACEGNGANRIEMDFLADVWVECAVCEGKRFGRETLQIRYKGASISDVLEMDVQQALEHFENIPKVRGMLQTLHDVGLDYLKLGQASTTLSGGEAQRIKLARELVKRGTGRTLYVLDEPTTGLHFEDIRRLLGVLHGFVDAGNTVVVIEHNLDVIKTADWLIDLGPEGGEAGGEIVVAGTPEEVADCGRSYTGQALREVLFPEEIAGRASESGGGVASGGVVSGGTFDSSAITVVGASQHNLRDLTVSFPRDQMTVCTGVSGSGKTSFAIDTVFTEGYRRYVESLSAYARQFLGQLAKPRVEHVSGLSPAICIEQKAASKSPRSTVGTITEVYDYMRVLWARVGIPFCPRCQEPVGSQTVDEIVDRVMALEERTPIMVLAPVKLGDGETWGALFNRLKASGYTRVRIDGAIELTAQATTLDARRKHRVEVVVDRTMVKAKSRGRISESVEHALALGRGMMMLLVEEVELVVDGGSGAEALGGEVNTERRPQQEIVFSQKRACLRCGTSFEELSPHHFSFNSQLGWCETCEGLGIQRGAPLQAIIRQPRKSLFEGAIAGWPRIEVRSPLGQMLKALCAAIGVEPATPLGRWTGSQKQALMFGTGEAWIDGGEAYAGVRFRWRGFFPAIDAATRHSWTLRHRLHNTVTDIPCAGCRGGRLRSEAAAVRLGGEGEPDGGRLWGKTIVDVCELPMDEVAAFFADLQLTAQERQIAGELLKEIRTRVQFLIDVGLDYLTLHRSAPTLSGGEAQRIRLASQIGSGLSGVLYVLDEPTIGLHPRDNARLIRALQKLRNLGNTMLVVEHDRDVIASADRVLDFGPRAGREGGRIVADAAPRSLMKTARRAKKKGGNSSSRIVGGEESLTRAYLAHERAIAIPSNRRGITAWVDEGRAGGAVRRKAARAVRGGKKKVRRKARRRADVLTSDSEAMAWLVVRNARQNNLAGIDVPVPLGRFTCVTGVSGSGKSSLVNDILWPALAGKLQRANLPQGEHDAVEGMEHLDKVVNVDQSPIGSTPSSNPATYTGAFDWIRELFARLPESKMRGYNANRFSFNRPGGRCEACQGYGQKCIEMHFMADVWVECEVCDGKRYTPETLGVRFKGKSIADVLEMRVAESLSLFENVPKVRRMLGTLADVGLDYVQLGQPAPTLSGGEAQRVKLAAELGRPDTGRTMYILDEPTTGLHFEDVRKLLGVVHRLVDLGNTVLVVEHNLDVIKSADWVIDLGPEAGVGGGEIVAMGTPEAVAECAGGGCHTGSALQSALAAGVYAARERYDPAAHAERELEVARAGLGGVGKGTKMPWQVDGRKWHLEQRSNRAGKATRWEAGALEYVIEEVEKIKGMAEANWNERASVEVTAPGAPKWFLHALTGGEWLLELYFRVPPGTFRRGALDRALGLKRLDERDDLAVYGNEPRVDVRSRRDGLDAVVVYVHDKREVDTPAFRRFLREAAKAYLGWVASH